jgi:hypothetical protein
LNGYRLTVDGTALSFDYAWKTDQSWRLTFFDPVEDQAKTIASATINFQIVDRPGGTTLKTGTLTITTPASGEATLAIADTDLPSLTWREGEAFKVLHLHLQVALSGVQAVADDRGNTYFPFRTWWSAAP